MMLLMTTPIMILLLFLAYLCKEATNTFAEHKYFKRGAFLLGICSLAGYFFLVLRSTVFDWKSVIEAGVLQQNVVGIACIAVAICVSFIAHVILEEKFSCSKTDKKIDSFIERRLLYHYLKKHYPSEYARSIMHLITLLEKRTILTLKDILGAWRLPANTLENTLYKFLISHTPGYSTEDYKRSTLLYAMVEKENIAWMSYLLSVLDDEELTDFLFHSDEAKHERIFLSGEIKEMMDEVTRNIKNHEAATVLGNKISNMEKLQLLKNNSFMELEKISKSETMGNPRPGRSNRTPPLNKKGELNG